MKTVSEDLTPLLTDEQKRLAQSKENLSESLNEIQVEIDTIHTYLSQVDTDKQVDFINDLVVVQDKLDGYLAEAEESLRIYSTTRTELISFADKEDIFFIPRLLNKVKDGVNGTLPILKKCQHEILQGNIRVSEKESENVMLLYPFFSYYQKRVYKMWESYEELYNAVYLCDKEEYGKRLDKQYAGMFSELYVTDLLCNRSKTMVGKPFFPAELFDEEMENGREIVRQENKKVNANSTSVIFSSDVHFNMHILENWQEKITESIKRMAPELRYKEFTDRDSLASYIHENVLLHKEANALLKAFAQLDWLENFKNEVLGYVKPKQKRGRSKCASFNDIDKQMLAKMYRKVYETEKNNMYRGSGNACAALFLIAMYKGVAERACEKVTAFCKLLHEAVMGIKIDKRTVQQVVCDYRCEYNKVRYKISERIQRYMDVVARIIQKLEGTGLILE